jgi:hypothetical protein
MDHKSRQAEMTATDHKGTMMQRAVEPAASAGRLPVDLTMDGSSDDIRRGQPPRLTDFPALAALRLSDADLGELGHQGFLAKEARGRLEFYKLRFRRAHRQVVRYVGAEDAAAIRAELARLQADCRLQRALGRLTKRARRMLRESKQNLAPIVATAGLTFHGLALRRPRKQKTPQ